MAGEPRTIGAARALLIALPFGLLLAWSQSARGPSRAELATALSQVEGRRVKAADLRSLRCDDASAGGFACRWEQLEVGRWTVQNGRLSVRDNGWVVAR